MNWIRRHWRLVAVVLGAMACSWGVLIYIWGPQYAELFWLWSVLLTK